ncbi:carboxypeptidase regulatory-like domain-containing protein [Leifsonia kafniensis]|uniref:carboxypeptidase regulatory-like domain-containing protein n=1 Tax=Leifsonia kafniensis TaxID=475957 RepID=UPI0031F13857
MTAATLFGSLLAASAAAPAFATSDDVSATPPSVAGVGPVLSGSVTTDAGDAAVGIAVRAFLDAATEPVVATTDDSGAFAFDAAQLSVGSYSVEFADESGVFATEWWQDAATRADAAPVVIDSVESEYLVANVARSASTSPDAGVETPGEPTTEPSTEPTAEPTGEPTAEPTVEPTTEPTTEPTAEPSAEPTAEPTTEPTAEPTVEPTAKPTAKPSIKSDKPSATPLAASTATISGTVKDSAGKVVENAYVSTYLQNPESTYPTWIDSASTNASGKYSITGLAAGSYTLEFSSSSNYITEWWSNAASSEKATYFTLAAGASTTKDAALVKGATISGTVKNASGAAISGVFVYASPKTGYQGGSATTSSTGKYSINGLAAGSYTLQFNGNSTYAPEWWSNAISSDNATYFTLAAGASTTKDASLAKGSTISGTVKNAAGTGIAGVSVYASSKTSDAYGSATTSSSGTYSMTGLAAGSYTLSFTASGYVSEWWSNVTSYDKRTFFAVAAGASLTRDAELAKGATISGIVKNSSGTAITGVNVTASLKVKDSLYPAWAGYATTDGSGKYSITGLAAGSYTLQFSSSSNYVSEWWSNAASSDKASYFALATGASATKDAALAKGATVSGTVKNAAGTGIAGVSVNASSKTGQYGSATTSSSGTYSMTGLAAGSYTLQFSSTSNYVPEWWSNALSLGKATYFALTAGASTTKDAALAKGATISGTVKNSAGAGIAGVSVNASSKTGQYGYATTSSSGKYSITGLAAGSYTLQFSSTSNYVPEWWSNAASSQNATYFGLAAGASTTRDAALAKGATISGTVKNASGAALSGVSVSASPKTGYMGGYATTNSSGTYSIVGLAAGSYTLSFSAPGHVSEWWGNVTSYDKRTYFALAAAASTTRDVTLAKGAIVTGVVKNSAGKGIGGAWVTVYAKGADGKPEYRGSSGTDATGRYSINTLSAGSYTLEFNGNTYAREWWSNAESSATATYFSLATGASTTRNAGLSTGGSLSGTVTGKTGRTIAPTRATIEAYNTSGHLVATTWAGSVSGEYLITGLKPGNYRLKFISVVSTGEDSVKSGPFITEYWNNKSSLASANVATVAAGKTKTGVNVELAAKHTLKTATPKVSGTVAIGKALKVTTGTWTSGTKFSYRWLADGKAISGATKSTFTITSAQKGKALSVKVTGAKTNYLTVSKTSAKTAKVAR